MCSSDLFQCSRIRMPVTRQGRPLRSNAGSIAKLGLLRAARRGVRPWESGVFGLAPWANSSDDGDVIVLNCQDQRCLSVRVECIHVYVAGAWRGLLQHCSIFPVASVTCQSLRKAGNGSRVVRRVGSIGDEQGA